MGMTQDQARRAFHEIAEYLRICLEEGEDVDIPGLGKFSAVDRAARTARNPRTGAAVDVPASRAVKFRPAKALRDALNPPQDQERKKA